MPNFNTPIPLTLYIHIPWCVQKCPYCDFNSHQVKNTIRENHYIDKLIEDLEHDLPLIWGRRIKSIFIGGGTPSLFSPESLDKLLREINARLPFSADLEITLEANPGTVEQEKFEGFKDAGINRLSIGIQSFNNKHLKTLGRIHSAEEAKKAVISAKNAGFKNINLDLMHGLPQQTPNEALSDLKEAIELDPNHISWYQLTIEPNTLFYHKPPTLPKDDVLHSIQDKGEKLLQENSYIQYEVSAFSKDKKYCQHNINYWEFGDYLGIGAGAHSKITDFSKQTITRYWKTKHPKSYLDDNTPFIAGKKELGKKDIIGEFMLNALRLNKPIETNLLLERTGLMLDDFSEGIDSGIKKQLMTFEKNQIIKSNLGNQFLNNLIECFF